MEPWQRVSLAYDGQILVEGGDWRMSRPTAGEAKNSEQLFQMVYK